MRKTKRYSIRTTGVVLAITLILIPQCASAEWIWFTEKENELRNWLTENNWWVTPVLVTIAIVLVTLFLAKMSFPKLNKKEDKSKKTKEKKNDHDKHDHHDDHDDHDDHAKKKEKTSAEKRWDFFWKAMLIIAIVIIAVSCWLIFIRGVVPVTVEKIKYGSDNTFGTHFTSEAKQAYSDHVNEMNSPKPIPSVSLDTTIEIPKKGIKIADLKAVSKLDWEMHNKSGADLHCKACLNTMSDTVEITSGLSLPLKSYVWIGPTPGQQTVIHVTGRRSM